MIKIALVSCVKIQNQVEQPIWDEISEYKPDVLVLAGDNVYGHQRKTNSKAREYMTDKYVRQYSLPNFRELLNKMSPRIISVWDDHDFGPNNSRGADLSINWIDFVTRAFKAYNPWCKGRIQQRFGIFHSYTPPEFRGFKFIALDVRTFRTKAKKWFFFKNKKRKFLGDEQWAWLIEQFDCDKHLILVSGSTFSKGKDGWKNYPEEREAFLELCGSHDYGVTLLSGDIHTNKKIEYHGSGRYFEEIISSGGGRDELNHWAEIELNHDSVFKVKFHGKHKGSSHVVRY